MLKTLVLPLIAIGALVPGAPAAHGMDSGRDGPGLFFEVVYWGAWMDRPLKYRSGGELKAIPLQNGEPSAYLYAGKPPLVFFREEVEDPRTHELKPVPILSVHFEPNWRRAALLVTPGADGKLDSLMIPLDEDQFPADSMYLHNASGKKLKCNLSGKAWELEDGKSRMHSFPSEKPKVYLLAASEWHDSWQVMFSDSFRPVSGERRIAYFFTPQDTEGVSAMQAIIPPDSARYDAAGSPIESAAIDPDFRPGTNPDGTGD